MSGKRRRTYTREFKPEAVRLITEKGYGIAEASRSLGVEYSVLRRWKKQLPDDPQNAFPGKGRLKAPDGELRSRENRALKAEWVNHHRYSSRSEAIQSLLYYIEIFYNRKRRHSSIS